MNQYSTGTFAQDVLQSLACGFEDWKTVFGDPWVSGTVFMLGYGVAAILMLRVARRETGREALFWRLSAWLFLFQVVNTHLDLHAFVVSYGRCLSRAQGWYGIRHDVLYLVLVWSLVALCLVLLVLLAVFFRSILRNLLLILGLVLALGTTFVKAVNYHDLEHLYAGTFGPFRAVDLIELSGVAIALLAGLLRLRRPGASGGEVRAGKTAPRRF